MSEAIGHFLVSLVTGFAFAHGARFALKVAVSKEAAAVGGMALVLGFAIGSAPIFHSVSNVTRFGVIAGYAVALAIVWYQFFKRVKSNG